MTPRAAVATTCRRGALLRRVVTAAVALCVVSPGLQGCARSRRGSATESPPTALDAVPYANAPLDPPPRIFLVAGGDDIANFAAEVLEQRTAWRRAGLPEEAIACYYSKPSFDAWTADREQFDQLSAALASCREASPQQLFDDLAQAAARSSDFVYLFVTGHGLPTQVRRGMSLTPAERAALDTAAIGLDGGAAPPLGQSSAILEALRAGTAARDLMLTPRTLAAALAAFDPSVEKIVVLQACFAGGFIDHHLRKDATPSPGADVLTAVPNLTVLTASAAERPSFGCDAGLRRTYFGGVVNRTLQRTLQPGQRPHEVDWAALFEEVTFVIETMEHIDGQRPSRPGFFSSAPRQRDR